MEPTATSPLPLPRIYSRDLSEWLTESGERVVRIERMDNGRTYRLVVAPAPDGVIDWSADWTTMGFFVNRTIPEGFVNLLITIN